MVTFFLIVLGNFLLKLTDDFNDEKDLYKYKKYVPYGLIICYLFALFIILTPEGMLLTGSFAITSPIRKKTDNNKYLITLIALILSFFTIYFISYYELIGKFILNSHFLSYQFGILFSYFILAVLLTHVMYETITPKILIFFSKNY